MSLLLKQACDEYEPIPLVHFNRKKKRQRIDPKKKGTEARWLPSPQMDAAMEART
jgi:hypothetical protein